MQMSQMTYSMGGSGGTGGTGGTGGAGGIGGCGGTGFGSQRQIHNFLHNQEFAPAVHHMSLLHFMIMASLDGRSVRSLF